jgi:hypothetical protein
MIQDELYTRVQNKFVREYTLSSAMKHTFLKLLTKQLWAKLKKEGFAGREATVRRIRGPVVHVVNVQGVSGGGACYINLGAHLSFLKPDWGKELVPEQLKEYECAFRARVVPPPGPAFGWAYLDDAAEAAESVAFVLDEWSSQADPFFARYGDYPAGFSALVREPVAERAHAGELLTFARIALELADRGRALELAREALARTPDRADLLRDQLLAIIATASE